MWVTLVTQLNFVITYQRLIEFCKGTRDSSTRKYLRFTPGTSWLTLPRDLLVGWPKSAGCLRRTANFCFFPSVISTISVWSNLCIAKSNLCEKKEEEREKKEGEHGNEMIALTKRNILLQQQWNACARQWTSYLTKSWGAKCLMTKDYTHADIEACDSTLKNIVAKSVTSIHCLFESLFGLVLCLILWFVSCRCSSRTVDCVPLLKI